MESVSTYRIEEILNPPLIGDLRNYPLPFVLGRVGREQQDGFLRLKRGDMKKEIVFKGGTTLEIRSNIVNECLGRFLQRTGKISDSVYEESLRIMSAEGKKQGEVLMAMGAISSHELPELLKKQARERFLDLFSWPEGAYRFFPSADIKEPEVSSGLELAAIIYEGVSTRFPKERIQVFLESHRDQPLARSDRQALAFDENRLKLSDRRILKAINGKSRVGDLLDRFGSEAQVLFYTLIVTGVLIPIAAPGTGAEIPRPPAGKKADPAPPPLSAPPSVPPAAPAATASGGREEDAEDKSSSSSKEEILEDLQSTYEKLRDLDSFGILGLKQDADLARIKQSYFRLARTYHPDRFSVFGNEEMKKLSNAVFALVSQAFATIGNEEGRKKYLDSIRTADKQAELEKGAEKLVNAELQYQKGEMLLKQKEYDQALEALDWAVKLNAEEPEYRMTLGWAIYKKYSTPPIDENKIKEAARLIKQATERNPRLDKGFYYLGTISKLSGNEDEARQYFTRALEINPKSLEAQRELRVFEMRKQKTEEKKSTFSRLFKR
ncbi:MAG: DnaJ domain-containing protein [bacterium]|nr:DnaJ domain-containing protein [bacterium]